ncbi:ferroxidase fet3 [Hanseniaspora uvarum]
MLAKTIALFVLAFFYNIAEAAIVRDTSNVTYTPQTHYFNWTTGQGHYNVDGTFDAEIITCDSNDGKGPSFPWPSIKVNKGDRVIVTLNNGFAVKNTSLHFHGLFQNGTNQMDGPEMITQCPIAPGSSFTYNFTVDNQSGSYWYHSHTKGQYMDGMKGTFVVEDPKFPFDYDKEEVLELAEWYHKDIDTLTKKFMNVYNPTGAEPIPQNLILNNTMNLTWAVEPDTTYLLRFINTGGFVSQYVWIEDHDFEVVEVDGVYVEPYTASMLYITVAQRYTVLLKTKNSTNKNYAIMQKFDDTMLDVIPKDLVLNRTSFMMYNTNLSKPEENIVDELDFLDDFHLVPYGEYKEEILGEPDQRITLDVSMNNLKNGINYAFFNNITFTQPKVPTLLSVLSSGNQSTDPRVYGSNTNAFVLEKDEIIEIVLNNFDTGTHPFHLHGHVFQVIERDVAREDDETPLVYDPTGNYSYPKYPMKRDTLYVRPQSNFVVRFKADNPGVWFFHCHIEWHLTQGLAVVLIEDPQTIQSTNSQQLTANHKSVCETVGVKYEGNAAGNTEDYVDLKGENKQHKNLPSGFTAKGIVAMTFSCLSGILGLITIAVYGLIGMNDSEAQIDFIEELGLDPKEVVVENEEPTETRSSGLTSLIDENERNKGNESF